MQNPKDRTIGARILKWIAIIFGTLAVIALFIGDFSALFIDGLIALGASYWSFLLTRKKASLAFKDATLDANNPEKMKELRFMEIDAEYSDDKEMSAMMKSGWLLSRAIQYTRENLNEDARRDFLEAVSLDPTNLNARTALATWYETNQEPTRALYVLKAADGKSLAKATAHVKVDYYIHLGQNQYNCDQPKQALESLKKAWNQLNSKKYVEEIQMEAKIS